jgi:ABC-type branched-subunit amino acid transport system ATPase component
MVNPPDVQGSLDGDTIQTSIVAPTPGPRGQPRVLLVDEPSIGPEPRYIDLVFEILEDLQRREGQTILIVEQNAKPRS